MKIYNTKTKNLDEFKPVNESKANIYVCGPTVYDYIHVGNSRPLIVFDVLRRYLKYAGYNVNFVQNYTDIDDKMIARANNEGITVKELAERFIGEFEKDTVGLNVLPADIKPKATEHIGEIIKIIKTLEEKGYAYKSDDGVYFDTDAYEDYGKLSQRNLEDMQAGARIKVNDSKKNPMDFALWKLEKPGEPSWNSPWGKGRPGWHIECSAMSMKYLGETIDIHCGGEDLVFPHHENETAQSEAATGKEFVKYWMHNGYININNQKMSKSLGNFFTVRDIGEKFDLEVLRFFMISVHYRSPVNFSFELMQQAEAGLKRLYNARDTWAAIAEQGEPDKETHDAINAMRKGFKAAMDSDLNTAEALGVIFEFVKLMNISLSENENSANAFAAHEALIEICSVLGILYRETEVEIPDEVKTLLDDRAQARKNKEWAKSDEIRDEILKMGYTVEDTRDGQKIKKA
ncbi:MAG: cysteine--tRNA ligase [Clostridia bacterium]|nr:cysteine--tRNA ligase [Clostridia bacterium]